MPPPAVASTLIRAISCCSFSCICCAWRIICCMLPGSFTFLLLEIANFANFAAEHFAEALHFRVGERALGGLVLARRSCPGRGAPRRRGPRRPSRLMTQRAAEDVAYRGLEAAVAEVQGVRFGGGDVEIGAGDFDAGVLHGVGQMACGPARRATSAGAGAASPAAIGTGAGSGASALAPEDCGSGGRDAAFLARSSSNGEGPVRAGGAGGGAGCGCARADGGRRGRRGQRSPASACSMGSSRPACTRRTSPISRWKRGCSENCRSRNRSSESCR